MIRSSISCPTRHGITDDIRLFKEKLREWEDSYNYHRPRGVLTDRRRSSGNGYDES